MRSIALGLIMVLGCLMSEAAIAAMYKWVDNEGNIHYSQVPPSDKEVEKIAPPPPVPEQPAKPPMQEAEQAVEAKANEQKTTAEDAEKRKADEEHLAEIYKKNCDIATENMAIYKSGNRIITPEGERVRLSDEMRAEKIKQAQEAIDKYCR
jgi:hypothetical protein